MSKATTYKKKLIFFIWGGVLLIFLTYNLGFRKTINAARTLACNKEQSEVVSSSESIKAELEAKLMQIGSQLGDVQMIDDDQEFVLSTVHQYAGKNRIRIIEITGTTAQDDNGIVKNTYGATIEGSYTDLVKLVRTFEGSGHDSNIASATFYRYIDNRTKKTATRLKFYIQELKTR